MELIVYRQAKRINQDGSALYFGEDALPYADDKLLLVADGLGGTGAIRHQKLRPELLEAEKLPGILFKDVYDDWSDERFLKYVTDSFFELFAVKDRYFSDVHYLKKTGYFGARIVAAVIVHETLCGDYFSEIVDCLRKAEDDEKRKKMLELISAKVTELVKNKLQQIADNGNLYYESKISNLKLLATTLCATAFLENAESVDTLYLTAGDSRPYIWDPEEGLMQVLPDEEESDGGMTNSIRAGENADFHIRCNYFSFRKPCVLFNASDGCFDSAAFPHPMAFEKLMLESVAQTASAEELAQRLEAFFTENGRHDDSSTIAMRMFGFDSYDALKQSAEKRLGVLQTEYLSRMEDLLERDYQLEYQKCAGSLPALLKTLKEEFWAQGSVRDYCAEQIKDKKYPPYEEKIRQIDSEIEAQKTGSKEASRRVSDVVIRNFGKLFPLLKTEQSRSERRSLSKLAASETEFEERTSGFSSYLSAQRDAFERTAGEILDLLDRIREIGVPEGFSDYEKVGMQIVKSGETHVRELFDFLNALKAKRLDQVRKIIQTRKEITERNEEMAADHPEERKLLVQMIIQKEIDPAEAGIPAADQETIADAIRQIEDSAMAVDTLETDRKADALKTSAQAYWDADYVSVISEIVKKDADLIPPELREKAASVVCDRKDQEQALQEKAALQAQLFEQYDVGYEKYMKGTAL